MSRSHVSWEKAVREVLCARNIAPELVLQWVYKPWETYAWFPQMGLAATDQQAVIHQSIMRHRGVIMSLRGEKKLTCWSASAVSA